MDLRDQVVLSCLLLLVKFHDVAATLCYVCKGAEGVSGITRFLNCPDIHDTRSTVQVDCVTAVDSKLSAPCLTFVGTQLWNPAGLAKLPTPRDGVLRLCLDSKTRGDFLGSAFGKSVDRALVQKECQEGFNVETFPATSTTPNVDSLQIRGLVCPCEGNLCNTRFNASLLLHNTSFKASVSWTAFTSALLLLSSAFFMQSK